MPRDLPALVVGLIVAFYWARVLRLAHKARRRTGRSANFLPPETLGRALRVVWYPLVVIWIVHPFLVAFRAHLPRLLRPLYSNPSITWPAAAIALLALSATLVCWKRMGRSWRMGIDPNEKTGLVVTGPYAYVRHPIYALSSLLMVATVLAVPSVMMLAVGGIHLLLLQWEASREERHLVVQHGSSYADYRGAVGRFIPRSFIGYTARV